MASIKEIHRKKKGRAFLHDYTDQHGKRHRDIMKVDTKKEAEELAALVEARIAEIKRGLREPPKAKILWRDFKMRVLIYYEKHKSPKTALRMKYSLINTEKILKIEYLQDISSEDIDEFKVKRLKKVAPATVSIELRGLKTAFNLAVKWNLINSNPVIGVSLPRSLDYQVRRLTDPEVDSLLDQINDPDIKDLILLYLNTGARRSELLPPNFGWDNINWEKKTITLFGKGSRTRWIPMNETVEEIFLNRRNSGNAVPFDLHPDTVTHRIKKYMVNAGIENASVHTLRKTFGSRLLESKAADIYTVSQLLGHSSVLVTERHYIDLLDESYHKAVRSLDYNNH